MVNCIKSTIFPVNLKAKIINQGHEVSLHTTQDETQTLECSGISCHPDTSRDAIQRPAPKSGGQRQGNNWLDWRVSVK